jgi:ABC-2 type transport system permease protein
MAEAYVLQPWRRGRLATARLYASFARLAFLKFLAYRLRYYTGVVSYTIFVAGNFYLYRALFASRAAAGQEATIGGLTLGATITYVIMSWVGRSFTFNNIDRELASSIQQGDIAMRLVKPFHVQSVMMAEAVGEAVFRLMMFTLPILVVVIPVFGLQRPADPARYGWTLLSFMLGLAVNSQINFLLGCLAFELKSIWGVLRAKGICIDFLSGVLIPFTFFPAWVQSSVRFLPFQGISYVPVMIYLEKDPGGTLAGALMLQAAWAVGLFVVARLVWTRAVRRVTLQGG